MACAYRWLSPHIGSVEAKTITPRKKPMTMRPHVLFVLAMLWAWPAHAAAEGPVEVWRSPSCGCCEAWVEHLEKNGFDVKVNTTPPSMLDHIKRQAGIGKDPPARSALMSSRAMSRQRTSGDFLPKSPTRSA
jgi:hypothetical protein